MDNLWAFLCEYGEIRGTIEYFRQKQMKLTSSLIGQTKIALLKIGRCEKISTGRRVTLQILLKSFGIILGYVPSRFDEHGLHIVLGVRSIEGRDSPPVVERDHNTSKRGFFLSVLLSFSLLIFTVSCHDRVRKTGTELRLGYFPNITHAQALVGMGRGDFERELGDRSHFEARIFNSGPSLIEALLAREIDLGYVGPSPALNGFVRSKGLALRIIAGAASGGAVFVKRKDIQLNRKEDYAGKRFASPQIGNTQDIALRTYLEEMGYRTLEHGGSVQVLPIANPDLLMLFQRKEIDGAWVPEPWGSILLERGNAEMVLDERELWPEGRFATTLLIASSRIIDRKPELVKRFLSIHHKITRWIQQHPEEAKMVINNQLAKITHKSLPRDTLDSAFNRLELTVDPMRSSVEKVFQRSVKLKYLRNGSISGIFALSYLDELLDSSSNLGQ